MNAPSVSRNVSPLTQLVGVHSEVTAQGPLLSFLLLSHPYLEGAYHAETLVELNGIHSVELLKLQHKNKKSR